jgi:integrase
MATITKRGDKYQAVVRIKGFPSQSKSFPVKAQAENWARRTEVSIMDGVAGIRSTQMTAKALLEKHRDEVLPTIKSEDKGEKLTRLFLKETWMALPADKVTADHIRAYRDERLKSVSAASVLRELSFLSGVFTRAIKEGWVKMTISPVRLINLPKKSKARQRTLTDEELIKIVGPSPTHRPETVADYTAYAAWLSVATGLRSGEVMQLTWSDIDLANKTIHIRDEWTPDNKDAKSVKNGESREIPLLANTAALLNAMAIAAIAREDRIFPYAKGTIATKWSHLRDAAGFSGDITFHDLRRTGLSRLAKLYPVMDLAKISGHRDVNVLLNTYYVTTGRELAERVE